jgi:hypothetical protein
MEDRSSEPYTIYQFKVRGQLDNQWCDWFGDLQMAQEGGVTMLWGPVPDQAALYGIIARLCSLGLTLLSVYPCANTPATDVKYLCTYSQ